MRVLWLCNIMLPAIAEHLGKEVNNKEGWLSGTYERLKKADFSMVSGERLELGICFPVSKEEDGLEVSVDGLKAYGFYEDTAHPENYDIKLEDRLQQITKKFKPDLVHCFGTEFPHTLAMTKAFPYPDRILVGIQGLCHKCADAYMANLPETVQKSRTFRDLLKQDSISEQYEKFVKRGRHETEALKNVQHVTGRTKWDKESVEAVSKARYHFMNETLRSSFYEGEWDFDKCLPHSIFMSQGDYPLKGLHFVLEAMPLILEEFPDTKLYIAGNNLTKTDSLKEKIKISGYGKYLKKLIEDNHLQDKVCFLGRLSAKEMKDRFMQSNLYICASTLENSPNSLGEAMLLGVPSIAPRTGGVPSVFEEKQDGLLFAPGNVEDLAEKVVYLFSNPDKMQAYAANAKKHAEMTHDADVNYKRLLEIYREIV